MRCTRGVTLITLCGVNACAQQINKHQLTRARERKNTKEEKQQEQSVADFDIGWTSLLEFANILYVLCIRNIQSVKDIFGHLCYYCFKYYQYFFLIIDKIILINLLWLQ